MSWSLLACKNNGSVNNLRCRMWQVVDYLQQVGFNQKRSVPRNVVVQDRCYCISTFLTEKKGVDSTRKSMA